MPRDERAVGRARARPLGRARVGRALGMARRPAAARTKVLRADRRHLTQIFVDDSGRRGRRVRRVAYVLAALAVVLIALFWLSQYGGPVGPSAR
jgi:hypothetical protein